jgi:hypothetical protein
VAILFFILGMICFVIIISGCLFDRSTINNGIEVEAIALKAKKEGSSDCDTFLPVFQYSIDGKLFMTKYSTGWTKPLYNEGSIVKLYYHKNNPKRILLHEDKPRNFIKMLSLVTGTILIVIAFALL